MSHEVGGTPEPAEDELALERAIDQTVNQTESAGDGERDIAQLQAALRDLVSSAEHWERVGDLHPYIGVFRDFDLQAHIKGEFVRSDSSHLDGIISVARLGTYGKHKYGFLTMLEMKSRDRSKHQLGGTVRRVGMVRLDRAQTEALVEALQAILDAP